MPTDIPLALSYNDVLLTPQYSSISSRSKIDLSTQITPKIKLSLPLISSNMDTVTGVNMAVSIGKLGGLGIIPRFNTPNEQADMVSQVKKTGQLVAAAIGIREGYLDRVQNLINAHTDLLVIDVAHGHMQSVISAIQNLKQSFPEMEIVAGNVATCAAAKDLFSAGADCIKVGIGPGAACTTRNMAGSGIPQITAVMESFKAAQEFGRTLLCDGGTKNSGDIVKGLAAGANAVVIGNLFAGTDESPGEIITRDNQKYKQYNGSTSAEEKRKQMERLGHEQLSPDYLIHVEGVSALVPYQGSLNNVIIKLIAGIRSGFSYSGAENINQLHQKAKFVRITPLDIHESNHHDIILLS